LLSFVGPDRSSIGFNLARSRAPVNNTFDNNNNNDHHHPPR